MRLAYQSRKHTRANVDRQQAIERLLDHYEHPRNRGALSSAQVVQTGGQAECGDQVVIYLQVAPDGHAIERVTFEGQGCTVSQSAASILTDLVAGEALSNIAILDENALIDTLGRDAVGTRPRCATLALNTLKAAIATYQNGHKHVSDLSM
jgi:nitrogen fixation protein NifU and related proteins